MQNGEYLQDLEGMQSGWYMQGVGEMQDDSQGMQDDQ